MRRLFNVAVTGLSGVAALSLGAAVSGMSDGRRDGAKERSAQQAGYALIEPIKKNGI